VLDLGLPHEEEAGIGIRKPERVETDVGTGLDDLTVVVVGVVSLPTRALWHVGHAERRGRRSRLLAKGAFAATRCEGRGRGGDGGESDGDGELHADVF